MARQLVRVKAPRWASALLSMLSVACGEASSGANRETPSGGEPVPAGTEEEECERPELEAWPDVCTAGADSTLVGVWDAYVETATTESYAEFVIRLTGLGETEACGSVTFGEGPEAPALPDDPQIAYFPEDDQGWSPMHRPWRGFEYRIVKGDSSGARLQLTLSLAEFWQPWCELQAPEPACDGGHACSPMEQPTAQPGQGGDCYYTDRTSGRRTQYDCKRMYLCTWICACNERACGANPNAALSELDLQFENDQAAGSMLLASGEVVPIRVLRRK